MVEGKSLLNFRGRNPLKGSNPFLSALESCPSGLWCKLGKFVDVKVPEVRILSRTPCWVGVIGNILVSKTKVQSSSL